MRFPAGLELVAVHAGAAANGAFVGLFVLGCLKRGDHGLLGDVVTVDVVKVAVPGLGGDRQQPHLGELRVIPVHPADDAGVRDPDRVGVGDRYRALEGAGLLDPGDAGHFAVAVLRVEPGGYRIAGVVLAAGVDRRDACPHFAALDQRLVADLDTWDVGDRVPWAWGAAERQAQRAGARLARGGGQVGVGTHGCQGMGPPGGPAGWRPGGLAGVFVRVRHTRSEPVCWLRSTYGPSYGDLGGLRGYGAAGSASAWHAEGQGFESP